MLYTITYAVDGNYTRGQCEVTLNTKIISYIVKSTMHKIEQLVHTNTTPAKPLSSGEAVYNAQEYEQPTAKFNKATTTEACNLQSVYYVIKHLTVIQICVRQDLTLGVLGPLKGRNHIT